MSKPEAELFDAPVLLVEARFRERTLCAHVLTPRSWRGFTVGGGRRADAPVDPRYLPDGRAANDNHTLVEASGAGFVINLSPAMRARAQRTPEGLRIPCGEVVFDISTTAPPPPVPRSWLRPGWHGDARIAGGVAIAMLLLLALVRAVPDDPHALSLDDLGRSVWRERLLIVPPALVAPASRRAPGPAAGGGARVAEAGLAGAAGDRASRARDSRRATKGPVKQDARAVEASVESSTLLRILDGQRTSVVAQVFDRTPALGYDAETVLAHLEGTVIADAFGQGGLGTRGTGQGGADTGRAMLGDAPGLRTVGGGYDKDGGARSYGTRPGRLAARKPHDLEVAIQPAFVRGALDKEVVRRVVRQHVNEVRFCYEQALVRRPALSGRVVPRFTISASGRVLVAALQSSSLGDATAEACIVAATRRWLFPAPIGGGLVTVSYPFQLTPAGG